MAKPLKQAENTNEDLRASREFMLRDLARSGLTPNDIPVEPLAPDEKGVPRYRILYPTPGMWRDRYDRPTAKYIANDGASDIFTIDLATLKLLLTSPTLVRLLVIEGEKKCAAWTKATGELCIAISGCWSYRDRGSKPSALYQTLDVLVRAAIARGVPVVIVPDGDVRTSRDIQMAMRQLVYAIETRGGRAEIVGLPETEGERIGLDDWLVQTKLAGTAALKEFAKLERLDWRGWPESGAMLSKRLPLDTFRDDNDEITIRRTQGNANVLVESLIKGRAATDELMDEAIDGRPYHDTDDTDLLAFVERMTGMNWPKQMVVDARRLIMRRERANVLADWLRGLKWDRKKRLSRFCIDYLKAAGQAPEYLADAGRVFITGMVQRATQPGCQFDFMLILQGEQGIGKTRALNALAGELNGYSLYSQATFGSKTDVIDRIAERRWLVNFDELSGHSRRDDADLKNLITATETERNVKFVEATKIAKRHCVFTGTTNDPQPLRDMTGNRRYLVVKCAGAIDVEAVRRDREQLFAEALAELEKGAQWWHVRRSDEEQEAVRLRHPWEAAIDEHLAREDELPQLTTGVRFTSVYGVMFALKMSRTQDASKDQTAYNTITRILAQRGWQAVRPSRGSFKLSAEVAGRYFEPVLTGSGEREVRIPDRPRVYVRASALAKA